MRRRTYSALLILSFITLITACAKGIDDTQEQNNNKPAAYEIRADVAGLSGTGLTLRVNNGEEISISENGTLPIAYVPGGSGYTIEVVNQPENPPQTCELSLSQGVVSRNIETQISCALSLLAIAQ